MFMRKKKHNYKRIKYPVLTTFRTWYLAPFWHRPTWFRKILRTWNPGQGSFKPACVFLSASWRPSNFVSNVHRFEIFVLKSAVTLKPRLGVIQGHWKMTPFDRLHMFRLWDKAWHSCKFAITTLYACGVVFSTALVRYRKNKIGLGMCRYDVRMYSFSCRIINIFNGLPSDIVNIPSVKNINI